MRHTDGACVCDHMEHLKVRLQHVYAVTQKHCSSLQSGNPKLIFYDFLKKISIMHFLISSKIISCIASVLFNVTMLDQTRYSLINPLSNDIFSRLVSTSGFNMKL